MGSRSPHRRARRLRRVAGRHRRTERADEPSPGAAKLGVVLDTSVVVSLERAVIQRPERIAQLFPRESCLAAISLSELQYAVYRADSERRRTARVQLLERTLHHCRLLPFGRVEAELYAQLWYQLEAAGQIIGERDLQIAATALAGGHELMTYNVDEFRRVPRLLLRPVA